LLCLKFLFVITDNNIFSARAKADGESEREGSEAEEGHKDNKQVESGLEVADFVSFSAPAVRLLSHM
jgi:hypothetical protein